MTTLAQMNPLQQTLAQMNQAGLDDPTQYGMIVVAYNQVTQTYIYRFGGWHLYYCPCNERQGLWTARQIEMELCLYFDRDELFSVMMAMMDQAESDAGDWLLAGLPPTLPDTPEEWQSPAERQIKSEVE